MKYAWAEKYYISFSLIEGCHWDLVCQAEVDITEPKAFVLLQVDLVCLKGKCSELLDLLRLVDAVPERTCWSMVDVQCSQVEVLLVTTSPITFNLEVYLRRVHSEDTNP